MDILVHDRFSSYFSYECQHSSCNAHILRDLIHVEETFDSSWAKALRKLLVKAKNDKEQNPNLKASYYSRIFKKYVGLIRPVIKDYDEKFKKTNEQRLAFGLGKHKYLFLELLKQPNIPFDNNQAERDLRMIKVKQKVSGCFRSKAHALPELEDTLLRSKKMNKRCWKIFNLLLIKILSYPKWLDSYRNIANYRAL